MKDDRHPGEDTLITFALGELGDRERSRVADHLAACPDCRTASGTIGMILEQVHTEELQPPDGVLVDLLVARSRRRRGFLSFLDTPQLAAAALFVMVFFFAGFWTGRTTGLPPGHSGSFVHMTRVLPPLPEPEFRTIPALDVRAAGLPADFWVRNGSDSTAGDSL